MHDARATPERLTIRVSEGGPGHRRFLNTPAPLGAFKVRSRRTTGVRRQNCEVTQVTAPSGAVLGAFLESFDVIPQKGRYLFPPFLRLQSRGRQKLKNVS